MSLLSRPIRLVPLREMLVLSTLPATFFCVLVGWHAIDTLIGQREVAEFIKDHQQIVNARRADPRVHSFSLSHDPDRAGALLIEFDVDDKQAYEMLESDLDAIWGLRFPPTWNTKMRTKEELSDNLGFGVWGLQLAAEGVKRLVIAAIASLLVFGISAWLVIRSPRHNPIGTSRQTLN